MTDPEQRHRIAVHESGHAAMAYLLHRRAGIVSIRPGAHHGGIAFHGPAPKVPQEMFDRHLGHPVPLLPATLRRSIETTIMISLAGDEAEFLLWCRSPEKARFRPETAEDEAVAEGFARDLVSLTRPEREKLDEAERSEHKSDEDKVWLFANAAVGEPNEAGAYLAWLRAVTRGLIWGTRCVRLIEALVPELLEHEVLSARAVRAILLAADGKKPRTAPGWAVAAKTT
jgi:hypothetical protein